MNSKRTTDEDEDGGENKLRAIIITTTTTAWRYGRNEGEFKLLMRKINRERRQGKGKGREEEEEEEEERMGSLFSGVARQRNDCKGQKQID